MQGFVDISTLFLRLRLFSDSGHPSENIAVSPSFGKEGAVQFRCVDSAYKTSNFSISSRMIERPPLLEPVLAAESVQVANSRAVASCQQVAGLKPSALPQKAGSRKGKLKRQSTKHSWISLPRDCEHGMAGGNSEYGTQLTDRVWR